MDYLGFHGKLAFLLTSFQLEIMCNDEYLPDHASMKCIYIAYWKQKVKQRLI